SVVLRSTHRQFFFFFSSRRRHTRFSRDWSSDVCSSDLGGFDYLLKTRHADMEAYREFAGRVLWELPGVRETRSFAVMEEVKDSRSEERRVGKECRRRWQSSEEDNEARKA